MDERTEDAQVEDQKVCSPVPCPPFEDASFDLSEATKKLIADQREVLKRYPDEQVRVVPKDGDYDHRLILEQLISAIICTRGTDEAAVTWLNKVRPPGTQLDAWRVDASRGPVRCREFPDTHHHVLVEC